MHEGDLYSVLGAEVWPSPSSNTVIAVIVCYSRISIPAPFLIQSLYKAVCNLAKSQQLNNVKAGFNAGLCDFSSFLILLLGRLYETITVNFLAEFNNRLSNKVFLLVGLNDEESLK